MAFTEEQLAEKRELYQKNKAKAAEERARKRTERAAEKEALLASGKTSWSELSVQARSKLRQSLQKGEQRKAGHALATANTDGMSDLEKLNVVDGLLIEKISNEAIIVANESCFAMLSEEQQKQHKFRTTNLKDLLSIEKGIRDLGKRLVDDQGLKLGSAINMTDETVSALEAAKQSLRDIGYDHVFTPDVEFEEA